MKPKNSPLFRICAVAGPLLASMPVSQAAVLVGWDFGTPTNQASNSTNPAPTTVASVGSVTTALDGNGGANGFATQYTIGDNTGLAASGTTFGSTEAGNFGDTSENLTAGSLVGAINASDYVSFVFTADTTGTLNISGFSLDTAVANVNRSADEFNILAQVNGGNSWLAANALIANQKTTAIQDLTEFQSTFLDLSGNSTLQGITSVEFRIYLWGANGTQSSSRTQMDQLVVEGTVSRRFDGSNGTTWATAANWVGDNAPDSAAERAVFGGDNGGQTYADLAGGTYTIGGIQVLTPDSAVAIRSSSAGAGLTVIPDTTQVGVDLSAATKNFTFDGTSGSAWTYTLGSSQSWKVTGSGTNGNLISDSGVTVALGSNTLTANTGSGREISIAGEITGTGGVTKTGAGLLTLSGTNTYSGATTVNTGTLQVSGSIGNSAVTVNGGILASGSTGTIGQSVSVNSGGILAAGGANAIGTATVTNATTFNNGSIFSWDLSADGSSYDKLITGSMTGSDAIFRIVAADSSFANSFWEDIQNWTDIFSDGSNPISNWASIFSSIQVVDSTGGSITPVGGSFSISGNTLTWTAVPEPSSALAGLLVGAGLLRRRRK